MIKNKTAIFVLLGAIIFGLILRFNKLSTNFVFGKDQSEDMYKLAEIASTIKNGQFTNLPLIGEPGTDRTRTQTPNKDYTVYTGVFYFYFLLPVAVAASFNPFLVTTFFAFLNALTIFVVYLAAKELFDRKTGFISAFLFAVSFWPNVFARAIWTPSMMPFFVSLSFYLLILIKKGKTHFWPLFAFFVSALSQIHNSGYFYLVLFIALVLVLKPKLPKTFMGRILPTILFFIPVFPTLVNEFNTGFRFIPQVFKAFEQLKTPQFILNKISEFVRWLIDC